jgi:GAF domain-containing protein
LEEQRAYDWRAYGDRRRNPYGSQLMVQAQDSLERSRLLIEVMRVFSSELDLDAMLVTIMDCITKVMHADRSTLFIKDAATDQLWSKVVQGDGMAEIRVPLRAGIVGHVVTTGETINIADAYQDKRFNQEIDRRSGYRTHSILCVPIRDERTQIIGAVQCLNAQKGEFSAEDDELLTALAAQAGIALRVAERVAAREQHLKHQVQELRIEIDEAKKALQVADVTNSDYFKQLQQTAKRLRRERRA